MEARIDRAKTARQSLPSSWGFNNTCALPISIGGSSNWLSCASLISWVRLLGGHAHRGPCARGVTLSSTSVRWASEDRHPFYSEQPRTALCAPRRSRRQGRSRAGRRVPGQGATFDATRALESTSMPRQGDTLVLVGRTDAQFVHPQPIVVPRSRASAARAFETKGSIQIERCEAARRRMMPAMRSTARLIASYARRPRERVRTRAGRLQFHGHRADHGVARPVAFVPSQDDS